MSKVEQVVINSNREQFIKGTYNKIMVIIRKKDGFINATHMCNQFNKKFRKIFENHAWQSYYKEFCVEYSVSPEMGEQLYRLQNGVSNDLRGTYVNPLLINYIAIWASPKYAIHVGKIMDSINTIGQLTNNQNYSDDH